MCWKGREEGRGRVRETGSAVDRDRKLHQGIVRGVMQSVPAEGVIWVLRVDRDKRIMEERNLLEQSEC